MIKSQRTKRRKIRNDLAVFNNNNPSKIYSRIELITTTDDELITRESSLCQSIQNPDVLVLESEVVEPVISNSLPTPIFTGPKSTEITDDQSESNNIKDFIASWAIQYKIPHNALNGLLSGLKKHKCFQSLPLDARTVLCTPSQISKTIKTLKPGTYHHFGLVSGIKRYAPENSSELKIAVGIDGLPLSKSSGNQFWPILAYIISEFSTKKVFPIGIYYGQSKPEDSNEFLSEFVEEADDLMKNGININDVIIKISISFICCDSPARAFVLRVKTHSGFHSCTRCFIDGDYQKNRVCFPYSNRKSTLRDHNSYINMVDEDYHTSESPSVLAKLNDFDLVKSFPLDYMHLVCLGVMKKLLLLWKSGPLKIRLPSRDIKDLSKSLLALNTDISSDFVRKSRSLFEVGRWKAVELRFFLLYSGPVVLKAKLNDECYSHFMSLSIAMIILLSPNHKSLVNYARHLLDYFVKQFQNLYGEYLVSHNVHTLLHLCDDYDKFGPLDQCSAFIFENHMKELKSFLRKPEKPLEQVINRYSEINSISVNTFKNIQLNEKPVLKRLHTNGPLMDNIFGVQYYSLFFCNIHIVIRKQKESDSFILTNNGEVVKCLNIIEINNNILILGKKFYHVTPFFIEPINSTILDMYQVKNMSETLNYWNITDIKRKMMIFNHDKKMIAVPVIHTGEQFISSDGSMGSRLIL
ncbi:uncharacterized protein LOC111029998 isoform X1 [Myzus persicae]|uniref:uncharacterized protein LOC111029998 isoform X1 n=1 Tax=Myzus persicae TaxID=13164 RepID=UPI000B931387|nr:uncharacterized protein LOC111029998 isoform X1 [Myzus persicae]